MDTLTLAKICHYAQDHIEGWELDINTPCKEDYLTVTSYVVACFLAQETVVADGVECEIVLDELCSKKKSVADWELILEPIVEMLGGWKK